MAVSSVLYEHGLGGQDFTRYGIVSVIFRRRTEFALYGEVVFSVVFVVFAARLELETQPSSTFAADMSNEKGLIARDAERSTLRIGARNVGVELGQWAAKVVGGAGVDKSALCMSPRELCSELHPRPGASVLHLQAKLGIEMGICKDSGCPGRGTVDAGDENDVLEGDLESELRNSEFVPALDVVPRVVPVAENMLSVVAFYWVGRCQDRPALTGGAEGY